MKNEIEPYIGIGSIKFGMSREAVRSNMGTPFKEFKKTPDSIMTMDAFDEAGLYVSYKNPGICDAIELFEIAEPIFRGMRLFGRPYQELAKWFQSIDGRMVMDSTGLTSYTFGIGLYAPNADVQPSDPIKTVIVFEQSYYD